MEKNLDTVVDEIELFEKLNEAQRLLESMVSELRFRGCEDNHELVRKASTLNRWFRTVNRIRKIGGLSSG